MLPTEETTKAFNEKQKGDIDKNEKDEIEINENIDENKDKEEKKYISEHGKFFDEKNKKKKFDEMLKIIEAIFTGNYSSKTGINTITYKELNTSYDKNRKDAKPKDNFIPKTPLILYYSSKELLAKYINNQYEINKANYDELLSDILSLIFYFKIPVIGEKWIEHYKTEKEKIAQEKNLTKKNAKIVETKVEKVEEKKAEDKKEKKKLIVEKVEEKKIEVEPEENNDIGEKSSKLKSIRRRFYKSNKNK